MYQFSIKTVLGDPQLFGQTPAAITLITLNSKGKRAFAHDCLLVGQRVHQLTGRNYGNLRKTKFRTREIFNIVGDDSTGPRGYRDLKDKVVTFIRQVRSPQVADIDLSRFYQQLRKDDLDLMEGKIRVSEYFRPAQDITVLVDELLMSHQRQDAEQTQADNRVARSSSGSKGRYKNVGVEQVSHTLNDINNDISSRMTELK